MRSTIDDVLYEREHDWQPWKAVGEKELTCRLLALEMELYLSRKQISELQDERNGTPCEQIRHAHAMETQYERLLDYKAKLKAVICWLEVNQSDVFRRGLWDVINAADHSLEQQ